MRFQRISAFIYGSVKPSDPRSTMEPSTVSQQDAFFAHIINGSAKPLGGEVVDCTDKFEFQGKGTSHTHSLLCVRDSEYDDSYFNDINEMTESKMREIVDKVVTATLSQSETIADFNSGIGKASSVSRCVSAVCQSKSIRSGDAPCGMPAIFCKYGSNEMAATSPARNTAAMRLSFFWRTNTAHAPPQTAATRTEF